MQNEDNYYESRLDQIFGKGSLWKHRTLRTLLDPLSSEWNSTDYSKKIEIMERILAAGENLEDLIFEYKDRYDQQNRQDISSSVESALAKLIEFQLKKKE